MDPGKSRNMPLQELLASRRPSPRHFSPVSGYPSFVQAPSLLDPLRRESVGSRRLRLEADVGDVPGRVPVSRCDRESRIPGVIPDYPGLSRIKTFDRPHCARSRGYLTPADVHYGRAPAILDLRHRTRLVAYAAHPERFVSGPPRPETLPTAVWINPPSKTTRQDAPGPTTGTPDDSQHAVVARPRPPLDRSSLHRVDGVESLQ